MGVQFALSQPLMEEYKSMYSQMLPLSVNICMIKERKKRSPIWLMSKEQFEALIKNSQSFGQALKAFGLVNKGRNNSTLKKRCEVDCIDISHIKLGVGSNKGRKFKQKRFSLEDALTFVFIEDSPFDRRTSIRYIERYNLLEYKCECGCEGTWNGKELKLQLDHVNGISNDNTLKNLRWICPNCHSQTSTFAGKNKRQKI